jgi:hypothetical protein
MKYWLLKTFCFYHCQNLRNVLPEKNFAFVAAGFWRPIGEISIAKTVAFILKNAKGGRL